MNAAPMNITPDGTMDAPAKNFFPMMVPNDAVMPALVTVSTKLPFPAFHFFKLSAPRIIKSDPNPPPNNKLLVLPAMTNPARPDKATNNPQGRVKQKSCRGRMDILCSLAWCSCDGAAPKVSVPPAGSAASAFVVENATVLLRPGPFTSANALRRNRVSTGNPGALPRPTRTRGGGSNRCDRFPVESPESARTSEKARACVAGTRTRVPPGAGLDGPTTHSRYVEVTEQNSMHGDGSVRPNCGTRARDAPSVSKVTFLP
mmetsp:Transcript_1275/g.4241  ORF Transcript_1275/g.4241 Transcript_1275/m.4241 type:complete len:259 (+) Transcript_1275:1005-1781(+)